MMPVDEFYELIEVIRPERSEIVFGDKISPRGDRYFYRFYCFAFVEF